MKKMKKVWALALAFVLVCTLLPFMGKEVKAADDGSVTWLASDYVIDSTEDPSAFTVGALTVDPLAGTTADGAGTWKAGTGENKTDITLTGSQNPRATTTDKTNPSADAAPLCGTALKINTSSSGIVVVRVWVGGAKPAYASAFEKDSVTGGNIVFSYETSAKAWVDITFDVEKAKDYYVYGIGTKLGYYSITFTPSPVSTLGSAYREESDTYGNGVRFGSELDKTAANYADIEESGTLVAIQSVVGESTELTVETANCSKVKRTTILSEDTNKLQYSLVVTNIPDDAKSSVLVARPYVKLADGSILYGEQVSGSWNSIKEAVGSSN